MFRRGWCFYQAIFLSKTGQFCPKTGQFCSIKTGTDAPKTQLKSNQSVPTKASADLYISFLPTKDIYISGRLLKEVDFNVESSQNAWYKLPSSIRLKMNPNAHHPPHRLATWRARWCFGSSFFLRKLSSNMRWCSNAFKLEWFFGKDCVRKIELREEEKDCSPIWISSGLSAKALDNWPLLHRFALHWSSWHCIGVPDIGSELVLALCCNLPVLGAGEGQGQGFNTGSRVRPRIQEKEVLVENTKTTFIQLWWEVLPFNCIG